MSGPHQAILDLKGTAGNSRLLGLDLVNETSTTIPYTEELSVSTARFEREDTSPEELIEILGSCTSIASLVIPKDFIPENRLPEFFDKLTRLTINTPSDPDRQPERNPRFNLIHYEGPVDNRQIVKKFVHGHNLPRVIAAAYASPEEPPHLEELKKRDFALTYYASLDSAHRNHLDILAAEAVNIHPEPKPRPEIEIDDSQDPESLRLEGLAVSGGSGDERDITALLEEASTWVK